jgi:hypothetical protein
MLEARITYQSVHIVGRRRACAVDHFPLSDDARAEPLEKGPIQIAAQLIERLVPAGLQLVISQHQDFAAGLRHGIAHRLWRPAGLRLDAHTQREHQETDGFREMRFHVLAFSCQLSAFSV